MSRVTVHLLTEDVPLASLALAHFGRFHPEPLKAAVEMLPEMPGEQYRQLAMSAEARFRKITQYLGLNFKGKGEWQSGSMVDIEELTRLNDRLGELWAECSRCEDRFATLRDELKHIDDLLKSLHRFDLLDMDLALLQKERRLLDLEVGALPEKNLQRYASALSLAGYVAHPFLISEGTAYIIRAGLPGSGQEIAAASELAGYNIIDIPREFRKHPQQVRAELAARRREVVESIEQLDIELVRKHDRHAQELGETYRRVMVAMTYATLAPHLKGRGELSVVSGWVPRREVPRMENALRNDLGERFVLDAREAGVGDCRRVPSLLRHGAWMRPFAALVGNYGTPRYGEIDPTVIFGISFILMFGMMFGDVGHGAVIAVGGWLLRGRIKGFAPFVISIGLSSMAFGFLYGSLFGFEEVVHPLWRSPLSDPGLMLELALYWGIGFILLATLLTIRNRLVEGRWREALLDGKGVAGIALYLGILFGAWHWIESGVFGAGPLAAIFVPLFIILGYHWRRVEAPLGEKLLVVFIEGFETMMNYIANTLSFLRVAAFSLNHVALAVAVFALADMMGTTGHWITVVLGNLFILVMEGAIVAIQVLRLEYYEGFSRFFSGDGRRFEPLTLPVKGTTG